MTGSTTVLLMGKNSLAPKSPIHKRTLKKKSHSTSIRRVTVEDRTLLLKATPFLLYIFKRQKDSSISPQMVVLYWEDQQTTLESPAHSSEPHLPSNEQQIWRITGCKIPISFDTNTESIAFAVAYVTANSVEFIDNLSCVVNPHELQISERVKVENQGTNSSSNNSTTDDNTTPSETSDSSSNSSSSSGSNTIINNEMSLHMEKKGSLFLEISELSIVLKPDTVRRVCQAFRKEEDIGAEAKTSDSTPPRSPPSSPTHSKKRRSE